MGESGASKILSSLSAIERQNGMIMQRLDDGAKTMDDHEARIRENTTDINNVAQLSRDTQEHFKEFKTYFSDFREDIKGEFDGIKPFTTFLQAFAKIAVICGAIATFFAAMYQFFPKGKTP